MLACCADKVFIYVLLASNPFWRIYSSSGRTDPITEVLQTLKFAIAPEYLKRPPGRLIERYDFLATLDKTISSDPLIHDAITECAKFRILLQHDLAKHDLKQRLGRLPAPLSAPMISPEGVVQFLLIRWEAESSFEWKNDEDHDSITLGDIPRAVNHSMDDSGFSRVGLAQLHGKYDSDEDAHYYNVMWGSGRMSLYFCDVIGDNDELLLEFVVDGSVGTTSFYWKR
jgi:hypothetical protein